MLEISKINVQQSTNSCMQKTNMPTIEMRKTTKEESLGRI